MGRKPIATALAAASTGLLILAGVANAGQQAGYKPVDKGAIEACLEKARRDNRHATRCIGVAARACEEQPDMGSTAGMRDCYVRENAVWDELLNGSYKQLLDNLSKKSGNKVRDMQRTWIKWRKQKCEMPYLLYEGGSMAGPMASWCVMETTAMRALDLEKAAISP
ncbi:MAG: DUF1311 domain-containing protein [Alphaproteobacteria bacterium]|nr:DUF1311 domain-containing protein [Alphaproteobacteria bacterium]